MSIIKFNWQYFDIDLEQLPGLSREGKSLDEGTTTISEVDSNENEGEYEDEEQYDIDDFEYQTTSDGLFLDYFRVLWSLYLKFLSKTQSQKFFWLMQYSVV